jgi:putative lipoprotein (rSAM/lipoprotein system)
MKKLILKRYDRIIIVILGLIGFLTGCNLIHPPLVEYGVPHAEYEMKGTVTDSITSSPVQNIRVIISQTQNNGDLASPTIDTLAIKETDSSGKYDILITHFPSDSIIFHVKVDDMDGTANGGDFNSQTKDVLFHQTDLTGASGGWYDGQALKTVDFKLKKK